MSPAWSKTVSSPEWNRVTTGRPYLTCCEELVVSDVGSRKWGHCSTQRMASDLRADAMETETGKICYSRSSPKVRILRFGSATLRDRPSCRSSRFLKTRCWSTLKPLLQQTSLSEVLLRLSANMNPVLGINSSNLHGFSALFRLIP